MKGMILFLIVVLSIYTIMNITAFLWLRFMFRPTGMTKHLMTGLFCILAISLVVGRVLSSLKGWTVASYILQAGYIWLGLLFYLVVLGIGTGILFQISRFLRKIGWIKLPESALLSGFPNTGSIIVGVLVALAVYGMFTIRKPVIVSHDVTVSSVSETGVPLTVVQLSDIHLDRMKSAQWWENIVDQTNALEPDIIALTGDIFDEHPHELTPFISGLERLTATYGVYGVTGNHEFYTDTAGGLKIMNDAGVTILRNSAVVIRGVASIVGIDDPTGIRTARIDPPDFAELKEQIPDDLPMIVLNHQPMYLDEIQAMGADLQLCGHTHDGQIWPFKFLNKIVFKYQNGLFKLGDMNLYVSSGTGTWGPPYRIGTQSEIAVFKLLD